MVQDMPLTFQAEIASSCALDGQCSSMKVYLPWKQMMSACISSRSPSTFFFFICENLRDLAEVAAEDVRMVVETSTQDVLTDRQYSIAQNQVRWVDVPHSMSGSSCCIAPRAS